MNEEAQRESKPLKQSGGPLDGVESSMGAASNKEQAQDNSNAAKSQQGSEK